MNTQVKDNKGLLPKSKYIFHFSLMLDGRDILHHGAFESDGLDVVRDSKPPLTEKLESWHAKPADIVCIEIYNNNRDVVFDWTK